MKNCTKCGSPTKAKDFPRDKHNRTGRRPDCKTCVNVRSKRYCDANRAAVRERNRAGNRKRRAANPAAAVKETQKWLRRHPDYLLKRGLIPYKLTVDAFVGILRLQNYCCAICGKKIRKRSEQHVDHDHKTNIVRGILCGTCNRGLGHFHDSIQLLVLALAYLRGYSEVF